MSNFLTFFWLLFHWVYTFQICNEFRKNYCCIVWVREMINTKQNASKSIHLHIPCEANIMREIRLKTYFGSKKGLYCNDSKYVKTYLVSHLILSIIIQECPFPYPSNLDNINKLFYSMLSVYRKGYNIYCVHWSLLCIESRSIEYFCQKIISSIRLHPSLRGKNSSVRMILSFILGKYALTSNVLSIHFVH